MDTLDMCKRPSLIPYWHGGSHCLDCCLCCFRGELWVMQVPVRPWLPIGTRQLPLCRFDAAPLSIILLISPENTSGRTSGGGTPCQGRGLHSEYQCRYW